MRASSNKERNKTCFLEHQFLRPMSAAVLLGLMVLVLLVVVKHGSEIGLGREAVSSAGSPFLGVRLANPDELVARIFDFPPGEAVLIDHVVGDSPAHRAGLRRGDGILAVNGSPIRTTDDISGYLDRAKSGDLLSLTVIRGGLVRDLLLPVEGALAP